MQKFLLSAILFFLVLITFALFFFFYETQYFGSRASSVVDISAENSYVFMNPIGASANGKDKIRVTIMILNQNGLGVLGKTPVIGVDPRVVMNSVQTTTDSSGKAIFEFSSTTPGDYSLTVTVDNAPIPQKSMLSFHE